MGHQIAECLGLPGARADPGQGDLLKDLLHDRQHIGIGRAHDRVHLAAQHFLTASPGRDEADAKLDQADVSLVAGHRFPTRHGHLGPAAQRQPMRRGDNGLGRVSQSERRGLQRSDHPFQLIEMAGCGRDTNGEQVGPGAEVLAIIPDHQGIEIAVQSVEGLQGHFDDVLVNDVQFGMEFQQGNAISHVMQARAVIALDGAPGRTQLTGQDDVLVESGGLIGRGIEVIDTSRSLVVRVEAVVASGNQVLDPGGYRKTHGFHLRGRFGNSQHVPHLEWSCLVAKSPAHRIIDVGQPIGDFGRDVGCIGKSIIKQTASILGRAIIEGEQLVQPGSQPFNLADFPYGFEAHLGGRFILQRRGI